MNAELKKENARRVHQLLGIEPELPYYEKNFLTKIALIRKGKLSPGQQRALDGIYAFHFGPRANREEVRS